MSHWRGLKGWVLEHRFCWIPLKAPPGLFDYLLLGAANMRAFYISNPNVKLQGAAGALGFLAVFFI